MSNILVGTICPPDWKRGVVIFNDANVMTTDDTLSTVETSGTLAMILAQKYRDSSSRQGKIQHFLDLIQPKQTGPTMERTPRGAGMSIMGTSLFGGQNLPPLIGIGLMVEE